jgi:hypothetical protein
MPRNVLILSASAEAGHVRAVQGTSRHETWGIPERRHDGRRFKGACNGADDHFQRILCKSVQYRTATKGAIAAMHAFTLSFFTLKPVSTEPADSP